MDSLAAIPAPTLDAVVDDFFLLLVTKLVLDKREDRTAVSFSCQTFLTRLVKVKERKMKSPWRELRMMKRYDKAWTSGKAAETKPNIQVKPIRLAICCNKKFDNTCIK